MNPIGFERQKPRKEKRNVLGPEIYRPAPGELRIILNSSEVGRLLGNGGKTVKSIRRENKNNSIFISERGSYPRYVRISGPNLPKVYFDIMKTL